MDAEPFRVRGLGVMTVEETERVTVCGLGARSVGGIRAGGRKFGGDRVRCGTGDRTRMGGEGRTVGVTTPDLGSGGVGSGGVGPMDGEV